MTLADRIKELIESEIVESGLLEGIKAVYTDENYKLLPADKYPAIFVTSGDGEYIEDGNKLIVNRDINLFIYAISSQYKDSESLMDSLIYNKTQNKGVLPFIKKYRGFQWEGDNCRIPMNIKVVTKSGVDVENRATTQAEIPLTVTIWK